MKLSPKLPPLCTLAALALTAVPAASQDLLVSSRLTDQILRYSATDGTFLGVFADGGGLDNPVGLTFGPDGDLYVSSANNNRILVFDGVSGAFVRTFVADAALASPRNLNFGPDGDLYVASGAGDRIQRYAADGTSKGVFAQGGGLDGPTSFTFGPGGDLLVASVVTDRVLRYDGRNGTFLGVFASEHLDGPHDVAYGPDGLVYVSNAILAGQKVVRFDRAGNFVDVFIGGPALSNPLGLTWSRDGSLFVASQGNDQVRRFDARTGTLVDIFVESGSGGLDGPLFIALMPETNVLTHWPVAPGIAGESNAFAWTGARPGGITLVRFGTHSGSSPFAACPGVFLDIASPRPLGRAVADESGNGLFLRQVPASLAGHTILFQAIDRSTCETSPVLRTTFR